MTSPMRDEPARLREWAERFGPEVRCPVGVGPDPAALIAKLEEENAEARAILSGVLAADREALADHRPKWGLADCADNDGVPYQSASFAALLDRARALILQEKNDA